MRLLRTTPIRPGTIVLVRVDWNVPVGADGKVDRTEDFKIQQCLPTLEFLLRKKARIILATHLGRPNGKPAPSLRLHAIKRRAQYLLARPIYHIHDYRKSAVLKALDYTYPYGIVLLENLRFYPEEEANDRDFAKELAACADLYVNNAFGVSHRAHASVEAITHYLPAAAGFLVEQEVRYLERILRQPRHPYLVLLGGAKILGKIDLVHRLSTRADAVALGGGIATTVAACQGLEVGKSFSDHREQGLCEKVCRQRQFGRFVLPADFVVGSSLNAKTTRVVKADAVRPSDVIGDVGPKSIQALLPLIQQAKMIVWNGPFGYSENPAFATSSRTIARAIAASAAFSLAGGGETVTLLVKTGVADQFSFVSTGGGAMIEYLEGRKLPGVEALRK